MAEKKSIAIAVDRVAQDRDGAIDYVADYGASDLLCYRAEGPFGLTQRQHDNWQPMLDWAADTHGASLKVGEGILFIEQPAEALSHLRQAVEDLDDRNLAALSVITRATGSLVIGLAVIHGYIDGDAAFEASQIDEKWQSEKWGEDKEDTQRLDNLRAEISEAVDFISSGTI